MRVVSRSGHWRRPSFVGAVMAAVLGLASQRSDLLAQAVSSKLTTVLQDVAGAVSQDLGAPAAQPSAVRPLAIAALPRSAQDALRARLLRLDAANQAQVYILMTAVTSDTLQQLQAAGVTVEITDPGRNRVQARIPLSRLQIVAALPIVNLIRLPTYAVRHAGGVLTEGDAILRDDVARAQLGIDGTGVRVGVLSDGLKGVFAKGCTTCGGVSLSTGPSPMLTGDLPSSTGTRNSSGVLTSSSGGITGRSFQANSDLEGLPPASPVCGFAGAGAEGTALLEIVHDLAPSAALSFANADTDIAFNQAVNFLAANNDVVVDDLGFFGEPGDGTSVVSSNTAAALNNTGNPIRAYVTSVGNEANIHYLGTYADSGVAGSVISSGITNAGHLHQFAATSDTVDVLGLGPQPYDRLFLPVNGTVVTFLTWDDRFGASNNNYDLYLVSESNNTVVARSTGAQTGTQDPVEAYSYTNTGAAGFFRVVVQNVNNAAARQLNLYSFEPECATAGPLLLAAGRHETHNYNTAARSVTAQSDSGGSPVGVISVGAICSASSASVAAFAGSPAPDESCNDRNHATAEFFGSRGPTLDGRMKPDISAIDGVGITAAGSFENPFFGTSAAAPHVAGTAALLLQAAPCLRSGASGAADPSTARSALRNMLLSNAVNVSGTAPDNTFGFGLMDGFASARSTLPSFHGAATITTGANTPNGASLTAAQLGFTDPNGCPLTRVSWTGGCGSSPDATLNCGPGTSSVSVSASNNGVSFSAAANVQVTVTSFAVAAAPSSTTVTAGQSAQYDVTVTAQGGTFPNTVSFSCGNLPSQVTCSFNPSTVTPGSGAVHTTLTISTTARSTAPTPERGPWRRLPAVPLLPIAAILAIALGVAGVWRRASARAASVCAAMVVAVVAVGIGCGSKPATPPTTPTATVSPAALTFANQIVQTSSASQAVTLTAGGSASLAISGITATGDFSQTNTCGSALASGTSCTMNVTFTPTTTGTRGGTLTITDNATGGSQTVALSGTGLGKGTAQGQYPISVIGGFGTFTQSATVTINVQ